jgi:hypothetical protein
MRSVTRSCASCAFALLLSLALAGCNRDWVNARDRAAMANLTAPNPGYKVEVLALMRSYLNDPIGVRDAFITEPALRSLESIERYTLCVRYTARTSSGQYAPSKDGLVMFRDGRVDRIVDAREICKDAPYQPFPELERLRPLERTEPIDRRRGGH